MPTYGYQCTQCDNAFETVQKITADPLTTCDKCGGQLRKKIFPVGIAFKGSGFYVNDYSSKPAGGQTTAASDAKAESAPAAGGEASAPSGPDMPQSTSSEPSTPGAAAPSPAASSAPASSSTAG